MNALFVILISGVIATHPASNPQGKILTPAESQSSAVYPKKYRKAPTPGHQKYWSKGGSLYCLSASSDTVCIARGEDGTVYGETVSRNEFGINGGIFQCPSDSNLVAFYRKDESKVTMFPLLDIGSRTGSLRNIRYPMNGMQSERISVGVYDCRDGNTRYLDCTDFDEDRYLTNISWSGTDEIFVQVLDRSQHHMRLNRYDASDGSFRGTVLYEDNDAWVEPREVLHFTDEEDSPRGGSSRSFIYTTDNRDGFLNLYLCDTLGTVRRIVDVDADIHFCALSGGWLYYTSAEVSPVENHLFRVKLTPGKSALKARIGKPERLTKENGWHSISFNEDGSYTDLFSSFNDPGWTRRFSPDGELQESLVENEKDPLAEYASCEVEFGNVKAADGVTDNYYRLIKPLGFDPSKKYPLIVYVYGGPHSQMVQNSWLGNIRMWEMLMAQRGYVVYVQDNRGTSNRGAAFEKAINRYCGQVESEDQFAGLESLLDRSPWIDRDRIGVHGWSYGGFMTITMATKRPEFFKVAVAGGPVIDWKWYEVMYGERYMDNPDTNPDGFASTSLINAAINLRTKLLICQGAIDDTVLWQHSLSFVQECIDKGIQLDYFPYPKDRHNMVGKARVHLYTKISDYFTEHL